MELNKIIHGDCLEAMKDIPDESIDAVVTDPPYELTSGKNSKRGFMGKEWDGTGIAHNVEMWKQCLRVLKPGGYLLSFGGCRTYHRMACAIEDAGFEIRDQIIWAFGSGFPKSHNIGVAVNVLETKEWKKINKAIDSLEKEFILSTWKKNLNNVSIVETQFQRQKINHEPNTTQKNIAIKNVLEKFQKQNNIQKESSIVNSVGKQSKKNQTEIGICIQENDFVQVNVVGNDNHKKFNLLVNFVEKNLNEAQVKNTKINIVLENVEAEIKQSQNNVKFVETQLQDQNRNQSMSIFTAQCDVKELLKENTMVKIKVEEVLKILRGKKKYSSEETINVICAVLTENLKFTILNLSKTFQNLDMIQKMECVSAINVTITESITEHLITNTVNIVKEVIKDKLRGNEREEYLADIAYSDSGCWGTPNSNKGSKSTIWQEGGIEIGKGGKVKRSKGTSEWEGWGTALKPALEPICMARKPLSEKTVAKNCLKHGTGGINIDASRVEKQEGDRIEYGVNGIKRKNNNNVYGKQYGKIEFDGTQGRFPSNLIHDNSEEVRSCFPDSKSQGHWSKTKTKGFGSFGNGSSTYEGVGKKDKQVGNASRYFKSIKYCPKASKKERNKGCEGLEDKDSMKWSGGNKMKGLAGTYPDGSSRPKQIQKNNHPTIKPLELIKYLTVMVSREGATILDPFMGSGTTALAAIQTGRNFIGIEQDFEYVNISNQRIKGAQKEVNHKLF